MSQQLMRSETDKKIAGVCGGLAAYLNVDATWIRLAFFALVWASGIGLAIYFILWVIMPAGAPDLAASIVFNDEKMSDDPALLKAQTRDNSAATVGVVLVLLGGFFLLSQLGWLSSAFWPLILVGAGAYFIFRRAR